MTTLTLEVPNALATKLQAQPEKLPLLLTLAQELLASTEHSSFNFSSSEEVYTEMLDFLAARPTPSELIAYKISPAAQLRLEELLEKNRESELTQGEAAELDTFQTVNHLMLLLKARVRAAQTAIN